MDVAVGCRRDREGRIGHGCDYQAITERDGSIVNQTRSLCLVEPYGPFLSDPDGDISEIKLVDPGLLRYIDIIALYVL